MTDDENYGLTIHSLCQEHGYLGYGHLYKVRNPRKLGRGVPCKELRIRPTVDPDATGTYTPIFGFYLAYSSPVDQWHRNRIRMTRKANKVIVNRAAQNMFWRIFNFEENAAL